MDALVASADPRKEHRGHSGVSLDAMRKGVVDSLVAPYREPSLPGALDQQFGRSDHVEQVDRMSEASQQIATGLIGVRRKAVEAETVDQQVRHRATLLLARHIAVELLVNDLQLLGSQSASIFVGIAERAVLEQLLTPDIRTDEREVAPAHPENAGQPLLQRAQSALSRGGGTLGVDDDRLGLRRQQHVALFRGGSLQDGIDQLPNQLAALDVAGKVRCQRYNQLASTPWLAVNREQARHDAGEASVADVLQRGRRGRLERPCPFEFRGRPALAFRDFS